MIMSTSTLTTAIDSVKHWYVPLIIGILLVLVGFYVFATPLISYLTLSVLFSVSFFVSGLLQVSFSIANRKNMDNWVWYLVGGILYFLFGLLLVSRPEISILTLPYVIGFCMLFLSANALGWAYDLKNSGVLNWGNVAIAGVLGLLFSFILIWNPLFAGLSLVIWTGMSFVVAGISSIMLAFHLKKIKDIPGKISEDLKTRILKIKKEFEEALGKKSVTT